MPRLNVGHASRSPAAWRDAAAINCELHSLNRRHRQMPNSIGVPGDVPSY